MIGPDKAAAQTGRSHRKRRHSKESDVTRGGAWGAGNLAQW